MRVALALALSGLCLGAFVDTNFTWTWLASSSTLGDPGVYGIQGVPSPENYPGARIGAALWAVREPTFNGADLYLFSGLAYSGSTPFEAADLWKFQTSTGMWTWILGPSGIVTTNPTSFPAQKAVFAPENWPRSRSFGCAFVRNEELYVFAGTSSGASKISDLWKFNTLLLQWAWISGPSTENVVGSYGTFRVPSGSNFPGARRSPACATPTSDSLFIFGGYLYLSFSASSELTNEMWEYNFASNQWSWVSGSNAPSSPTVFGSSTSSAPGSRTSFFHWSNQRYWYVYAGFGYGSAGVVSYPADLWRFEFDTLNWTLLIGKSDYTGSSYGALQIFSNSNFPGVRTQGMSFMSSQGSIFLFGGFDGGNVKNDLWEFDPETLRWRWIAGNSTSGSLGMFGVIGERGSSFPQPLQSGSFSYIDEQFFLFGGQPFGVGSGYGSFFTGSSCAVVYDVSSQQFVDCYGCKLGQYVNTTNGECTVCQSGKYSATFFQQKDCEWCPEGTISSESGSTSCSACPPGSISTDSRTFCQNCPAGKSSFTSSTSCFFCQPGFSSQIGEECIRCSRGSYSSDIGSTSCSLCGSGDGITTLSEGSTSVYDCMCSENYWGFPPGRSDCKSCLEVEGVLCPMNSSVPFVLPGFYRSVDDPGSVTLCVPAESCEETGFELITKCKTGYEGRNCGNCQPFAYFRLNLECVKCSRSAALIVTMILLAVVMGIVIIRLLTSQFQIPVDVRIVLSWVQVISLYPKLSTSWPRSLSTLFNALSFSNLNVDLFSPECAVNISFWDRNLLKLLMPFFLFAWLALFFLLQFLYDRYYKRSQRTISYDVGGSTLKREKIMEVSAIRKALLNLEFLGHYIFSLIFTAIATASVSIFNCSRTKNSESVLVYAPAIQCFSEEWFRHLPVNLVFLIIYMILIPGYIMFNFWKFRNDSKNMIFLTKFGALTRAYNSKWFFWELFDLFRKAAYVTLVDFLSYDVSQFVRIFSIVALGFITLTIEATVQPFRTATLNRLNLIWNVTSLVILLSNGLIFSLPEISQGEKDIFVGLIFLLISGVIVFSLYNLVYKLQVLKKNNAQNEILSGPIQCEFTQDEFYSLPQDVQDLVKQKLQKDLKAFSAKSENLIAMSEVKTAPASDPAAVSNVLRSECITLDEDFELFDKKE